ncbi:alpha/beta hydrolase [Verminephrobacter aporrectodeae subsp. tuberculatae]|uniref:Alpha/beta hydrolase n=1 Tax=Verminephrobacter aporrectodeae subsp. tuberculatae TaxID=1110392 RepID=A0ABT3KRC8_9BURK|nr:alpha/beta hydrolase [Verminephrobacter aporrectodeae]MCW5320815.1 alpha/beta hydrolase [Verminephrobacter aporrectodeae subsp. tuberculatae]
MRNDIPLVMVHGLFGPLHCFNLAARMPEITVLTPDLLGYGSREPQAQLSLAAQADEVVRIVRALGPKPCHLLGHSVGWAVVVLAAARAPDLVKSIVSAEGNFTLDDAFMCRRIAPLGADEWANELQRIQSDPAAWLSRSGIAATAERLQMAHCILHNQPAATLQAMARAVVEETAELGYLQTVRQLMARGIAVHLLAGSRSAASWNVPAWVRQGARSDTALPGCGHMMMLEEPDMFCHSLLRSCFAQ